LTTDLDEALRAFLSMRVREGYMSRDYMIEVATEVFGDDFPETDITQPAARIADELLAAHAAAEATWDAPTDPDRLRSAFGRLEAAGLVVRENFADCSTCGFAEIQDEIDAESKNRAVRGFAFFHEQDTERVAEDGVLYVAYGAASRSIEATEIGREVANALSDAGFSVTWDGSINTRIGITGLDWRQRRGTPAAR
jgi:hypothetical protein